MIHANYAHYSCRNFHWNCLEKLPEISHKIHCVGSARWRPLGSQGHWACSYSACVCRVCGHLVVCPWMQIHSVVFIRGFSFTNTLMRFSVTCLIMRPWDDEERNVCECYTKTSPAAHSLCPAPCLVCSCCSIHSCYLPLDYCLNLQINWKTGQLTSWLTGLFFNICIKKLLFWSAELFCPSSEYSSNSNVTVMF